VIKDRCKTIQAFQDLLMSVAALEINPELGTIVNGVNQVYFFNTTGNAHFVPPTG
jgi:hypothetical protein